jgi:protein required for attachment to host cells
MSTMWILVCDSSKARFFEAPSGDAPWHLLTEVFHEGSRSKAAVLEGDRSGSRSSQGRSVHHNALAPASSPKDVEKQHFAHELAKTLDEARRSSRFHHWALVAPPHFVGLIERELTPELEKSLLTRVNKDFNHLDARELKDRLGEAVSLPLDPHGSVRSSDKHAR